MLPTRDSMACPFCTDRYIVSDMPKFLDHVIEHTDQGRTQHDWILSARIFNYVQLPHVRPLWEEVKAAMLGDLEWFQPYWEWTQMALPYIRSLETLRDERNVIQGLKDMLVNGADRPLPFLGASMLNHQTTFPPAVAQTEDQESTTLWQTSLPQQTYMTNSGLDSEDDHRPANSTVRSSPGMTSLTTPGGQPGLGSSEHYLLPQALSSQHHVPRHRSPHVSPIPSHTDVEGGDSNADHDYHYSHGAGSQVVQPNQMSHIGYGIDNAETDWFQGQALLPYARCNTSAIAPNEADDPIAINHNVLQAAGLSGVLPVNDFHIASLPIDNDLQPLYLRAHHLRTPEDRNMQHDPLAPLSDLLRPLDQHS